MKLFILVQHGLKMCVCLRGYSAIFPNFFHFWDLAFHSCDMMMWVPCGCNSSDSLYHFFFQVFFIMASRCACLLDIIIIYILYRWLFFRAHYYQNTQRVRNFFSFPAIIMKFCKLIVHALKLCIHFWDYLPFILFHFFHFCRPVSFFLSGFIVIILRLHLKGLLKCLKPTTLY